MHQKNIFIQLRAVVLSLVTLIVTCSAVVGADEATTITTTQTLSQEQLVKWVLARNPSLEELKAAVEEAVSRVIPAGSLDDTQLSYAFAPATVDGFRRADGSTRGFNQRIELSQTIPWPGTLSLRKLEAQSEAHAIEQSLADQRLQIIAAIKTGFAEWYYVHHALILNRADQALLIELRNVAEAQYASGRAGQQDVIQAEVEHASLQEMALVLERKRRTIQAQLNALINRRPDETLPPPGQLKAVLTPPKFDQLQLLALEAHPELKQLAAEQQASKARIGLAEKKFYPDFKLMAGYNNLWDESDKQWTIGASINLPFDREKYNAALGAARAGSMKTRWHLIDRRNRLLADLARSRAEVIESVQTIQLYQDRLLPLVDENLRAAEADYRAGIGDFLNVITAENRKLETALRLERTRSDYVRRIAELERWTGTPIHPLPGQENTP